MRVVVALTVAAAGWTLTLDASAADYRDARAAAVRSCEAIDPAAYQTGLLFNPDGYRSYYLRSECFQRVAVEFRDETLCSQVRRRRSLLFSSWGYSAQRCRELVGEGDAADRASLDADKRRYTADGIRLREFRIERNGNGRDFDIVPAFTGGFAHAYRLTFEIVARPYGAPVLLHSDGYYVDASSNLRILVRQADIRERLPDFTLGRPYQVRATLLFSVGTHGPSAWMSDEFIEQVFPLRERSQAVTREVVF